MNMSKEEGLKWLAGILGQEEADKVEAQIVDNNVQAIADAQIFYDVFCTGRGPEMLELLKDKTVRASTMSRAGAIFDGDIPLNPSEYMAGREMQNALVRWIDRMIAKSQESVSDE